MKFFYRVKASIRRRMVAFSLRWALKSWLGKAVYYVLIGDRFGREVNSILHGKVVFNQGGESGVSAVLRRNIHRLEKGLIMRPRRPVFALEYIDETVTAFEHALVRNHHASQEELCWARDVLNRYFKACAGANELEEVKQRYDSLPVVENPLTADRAPEFAPYQRNSSAGPNVSYDKLLELAQYRRSVRWFQAKPVPRELVEKAVRIAALSPSACNRQPFEFRFFDDPEMLHKVAALPTGTAGFHEQFPLIGVVLGNLANYYDEKDRHVIYIDGGLATMSLVFALETLGLSSCCINWPDIEECEQEADRVLGLKRWERPVMFIAIGYEDPETKVPYSAKKSVGELCKWNVTCNDN